MWAIIGGALAAAQHAVQYMSQQNIYVSGLGLGQLRMAPKRFLNVHGTSAGCMIDSSFITQEIMRLLHDGKIHNGELHELMYYANLHLETEWYRFKGPGWRSSDAYIAATRPRPADGAAASVT